MKRPEKPHRKRDQSLYAIMLGWLGLLGCAHFTPCFATDPITMDPKTYHLGVEGLPEWRPFDGKKPHARELHLKLPGLRPDGASTLILHQQDVKEGWEVRFNQHPLGRLFTIEQAQVTTLEIPLDWMDPNQNELSLLAPKAIDDIVIGPIQWVDAPLVPFLNQAQVQIHIVDGKSGQTIPGRITLTDDEGFLYPVHAEDGQSLAIRPGVVYTGHGKAHLGLAPGSYRLYASRGFEYGVHRQSLVVERGDFLKIECSLEHEVDTGGWIAADTHIHTRTFSGHGDATLEETMLSIAGEGIELAVATDHNHHTDYRPSAKTLGVAEHFTPVIGNEVTTAIGHFNIFPIHPEAPPPNHTLGSWQHLLTTMRGVEGVRVIVLNHPRNVHGDFSPMAPELFDPMSGIHAWASAMAFDGMEVITSAALQSDPMLLFRDWFALLNRGHRLVGLGSSDTHDISRFIVGQGRTYIRCEDELPSGIDIEEACQAFLNGRALISMGLWVNMTINDRFEVGDHVPVTQKPLDVQVEVAGPSWTTVEVVELYQNGKRIEQRLIQGGSKPGKKATVRWQVDALHTPSYLVAVARGPAVEEPFWTIPRPYQHASMDYQSMVIGATNPIWIGGNE